MKKLIAKVLIVAMCMTALAGCGKKPEPEPELATPTTPKAETPKQEETVPTASPTAGGTITISLASSPKNLDPILYTGVYESQIIYNVCDTVVSYNTALSEIVPSLATEWTISDDGLQYTFKLRDDVYFQPGQYQEGRKMTAADVAYSLERSATQSAMNRLDMLDRCEVVSDTELICYLKTPNAAFITALTDAGNVILPKEEVEGWGDEFGSHLIGTGPFILESFELDQQSVLKRNDKYWLTQPYLDGVVFKVITDSNQAVNALRTGEIDMATDIVGEAVKIVRDDSSLNTMEIPGLNVAYVYFNMNNGPTKDIKVREALIKAINVEEMTAGIYQYGEAVPATLPVPPGSWGYDVSLESIVPTYDPEGAKELLAEAGYPDGFKTDIYLTNATSRVKMATLLQQYLKSNLNVDVEIHKSEWGTFSDIASSGNADLFAMSWSWYPDPFFFLNKLFSSTEIGALGNGQAFSMPEVDNLLDQALKETEQANRAELYKQALKLIVEQHPGIFYANENVTYGSNKKVQDFLQRSDKIIKLVTPETNVWLAQ